LLLLGHVSPRGERVDSARFDKFKDYHFDNTTKELNLGGEYDRDADEWITTECDVEGNLSSLKNMTQLEALNLNRCDKVTGSLKDLKGLVNLEGWKCLG